MLCWMALQYDITVSSKIEKKISRRFHYNLNSWRQLQGPFRNVCRQKLLLLKSETTKHKLDGSYKITVNCNMVWCYFGNNLNYVYMVYTDNLATNSYLLYRKIAHLRSAFMSNIAILTSINMHTSNSHILKPYIVCLQLLCIAYYLNIKLVPLPNDSIQLGWLTFHLLIALEMDEMKGRKPSTFKSMLCCASSYCHIISNNLLMGEPFFFKWS